MQTSTWRRRVQSLA